MQYARMGEAYLVRLETDEEIVGSLAGFAADRRIDAASVNGIGAAHHVVLGYYAREAKRYDRRTVAEECEIVSLAGNITIKEGAPFAHLHLVLGLRDFTALAGHLFEGLVGGTCEVVVTPLKGFLQRTYDERTGLFLIDL